MNTISGRKIAAVLGDLRVLVSSPDGGPNSGTFAIAIVYEAATGRKPTKPIEGLRTGDRYLDRAFAATLAMPPAERPIAILAYLLIYSEVVEALSDQEIAALGTWFLGQRLAVDIPGKALLASGRLPDDIRKKLAIHLGMAAASEPLSPPPSAPSLPATDASTAILNLSGFTADPAQVLAGRAAIKASYGPNGPGPLYVAKTPKRVTVDGLPQISEEEQEEAERLRAMVRARNGGVDL